MAAIAQSSQYSTDVLIIGGGIIGCSIAYYLSAAGIKVTVLDRGEIGAQASSAAAGLLAPLGPISGTGPYADLLLSSFARFPALVPELEAASGLHLDYSQTGALRTVSSPKGLVRLKKRIEAWQPLGLQLEWLDGEEARRYEPLLSPEILGAAYAPTESQISAPSLTRAFARAGQKLGVRLSPHQTVIQLQSEKTRITGVLTHTGEQLTCKHLVIATGAWTAAWESFLSQPLPVQPLKGQLLTLQQPVGTPLQHIIFGNATYLVPKPDNQILVGATREEAGFDLDTNQTGRDWLLNSAQRLAPDLVNCRIISHWAGLRPGTPDTRPILGPAPDWENVTIAAGHNSVGILLSAITGEALATSIITGQTPPLLQPFTPMASASFDRPES